VKGHESDCLEADRLESRGIEECQNDHGPTPLPFPSCVRDLPIGRHRASEDALAALERLSFSFEALRSALEPDAGRDGDGPRAA
jgi:hypothetical protein